MRTRNYKKLLIGFFIIMLALTVLSRAADSVTIARVSAEKAKHSTLAHSAVAEGKIRASDQDYIRLEAGGLVKKIHVGEGQEVKAGDVLFTMDLEAAQDQRLEAEAELASLKLNLRKAEMESSGSASEKEAVEDARRALERAVWDRDFNAELNGGKVLLADKRAVEDAEAALNAAAAQLEEGKDTGRIDLELLRAEMKEKEKSTEKLRAVCENGGDVLADSGGIVGDLFAETGKKLADEILCTLIPDSATYELEAEMSEEEAEYIKSGDEVSVTLSGKNVPITGLSVKSIRRSEGKTRISVEIPPDAQVYHNMSASVKHSSISQSYSHTIPLSALRGNEGNYYVLVIKETNTVLGQELTAVKTEVTVLEMDQKRAALQDLPEGRIIADSSKPIEEGDRVREAGDE